MSQRLPKIAFEEHFMAPGFESYSKSFTKHITGAAGNILDRLRDFDKFRIPEMDEAGIEIMVLSQTGPSVQAEQSTETALIRAKENNDYLAERIAERPDRFRGFATLPMQSPEEAASELTRTVKDLGFKGALISGHTNGVYLDAPAYDAFWEAVQALGVPIYLHPIDFPQIPESFQGHPELFGATWGWGVETGTHALRILFSGVFDRFPDLKLVLGHMGEGLPMLLWRFDSRFAAYPHGVSLERRPSEYFGSNIVITTTGVCSSAALECAVKEVGADAVMFSVDYPYESSIVAADFVEQANLPEDTKRKICWDNAAALLKLA